MISLSSNDSRLIYGPLAHRRNNPLSHLTLGILMKLMTLPLLLGLPLHSHLLLLVMSPILHPLGPVPMTMASLGLETMSLGIQPNLLPELPGHLLTVHLVLAPRSELLHVLLAHSVQHQLLIYLQNG